MNGMRVDNALQAARFVYTVLFGIGAGILYGLLRRVQRKLRKSPVRSALADVSFWCILLSAFILLIQRFCGGELRIYMGLGILTGAALHALLKAAANRSGEQMRK